MKTLILITLLFFTASAQIPTGTATPAVIDIAVMNPPRTDPTQNMVCDYFVANWGKARWPGTKTSPWSYQFYHRKRLKAGTWVCDVSNNKAEVNGF